MINKVKLQQNGYLVNGSMSVPNDPSNRHYQEVQEWLNKGNKASPEFTLAELRTQKISELTQAYQSANTLDIAYMNTTFQSDNYSQDLITKVLSAGAVPANFYWVDALNNQVPMTFTDLQGLSSVILIRNQANFDKLQVLKASVKTATKTQLKTIVYK